MAQAFFYVNSLMQESVYLSVGFRASTEINRKVS